MESKEKPGVAQDALSDLQTGASTTGEPSDAAAENSTQAAKKLYPGEVSVNPQTGAASVQFSVPAFAGLRLALSYSSIAARYGSPFMLPAGVNLMGIPFVYKNGTGFRALNLNGQDYYLDDQYASILTEGDRAGQLYRSGLKYQTSQNILFKNLGNGAAQKIRVHAKDQRVTECTACYELQVYDNAGARTTFFFDEDGFCIFIASKYFKNDAPFNYKYVVSLAYSKNATANVLYSKLRSITDPNGNRVEVSYENGNPRFTYPVGASGQAYEVYILKRSSEIVLGHSLDAAYDYQLVIRTSDPQLSEVKEVIYHKKRDEANCSKRYLLSYTQDNGVALVSQLRVVDGHNSSNVVTTSYKYSGDREHKFNYGHDKAYDAPDIDTSRVCYETRILSGRNQTHHYYNKLSQEIKTEIRSLNSTTASTFGDLIYEVNNIYPAVVRYDAATKTNRFLANFQFPAKTLAIVYDQTSPGVIAPVGVCKMEYSYGDYGNLLREANYPAVKFSAYASSDGKGIRLPDFPGDLPAVTETSNQYDYRFVTLIKQIRTDHTMDKVEITENRLTDDGLNLAVTMPAATNIAGNKKQLLKNTEYGYAHDGHTYADSNFFDAATVMWEKEYFPGDDENSISSYYSYNLSDGNDPGKYGTLTVKKRVHVKSAANVPEAVTTECRIEGLTVKEIGATNLVTHSDFNVSQNLVSRTYPAGVGEVYSFDYIKRTYRSEIIDDKRTERYLSDFREYDFINQLLYKKERCEKDATVNSYTVAATVYDYGRGGLAVEQFDANGNKDVLSYEKYRGLLQQKKRYQKNRQGVLEHFGNTDYKYAIGWFDNHIKNCFIVAEETVGGEHGQKTVTKALNKNTIYERCTWVGGALKSKVVNEFSLSGIKLSEKNYVPGKTESNQAMQLRSRQQYHYDLLGRTERISQELFDEAGNAAHSSSLELEYDRWNVRQEVQRKFLTKAGEISTYRAHYNLLGKEIAKSYRVEGKELRALMTYNATGDELLAEDFNGNVSERSYDPKTGLLSSTHFKDGAGRLVDSVGNVYNAFARLIRQVADDSYGVEESVNAVGLSRSLTFVAPEGLAARPHPSKAEILYDDQNRILRYSNVDGLAFRFTYLYSGNVDGIQIEGAQGEHIGAISNEYHAYDPEFPLLANKLRSARIEFNTERIVFSQNSTYAYDGQGRLQEESCDDGTRRISTSYTYNRLDQVTGKTSIVTVLATSAVAARVEQAYQYNERNQLIGSVVNDIAGGRKITHSYVYDDFGNIKVQQKIGEGGKAEKVDVKFTYNNINQLLEKTTKTLRGDGAGSSETTTYRYDNNGNVIRETTTRDGAGDVVVDYVYNVQNQLVSVANEKGTCRYSYYPTGQRAMKQKDGRCVLFYYDTAGNLCNSMLVDGAGDPAACKRDSYFGPFRYIRTGPGGAGELQAGHMRLNSSDCTTIVTPGRPLAYQTQSVSDYGKVSEGIAAGEDPFGYMQYPFLYGAAHYDGETGLQYMQARYYSPVQERFLAQDSADFEDVPNRYIYALSNPVMNYDPDGHISWERVVAATAATLLAVAGLALAPATAGGSEVLAMDTDMLYLFAETASEATVEAFDESALAAEGVEALSLERQMGGNALFFAGTDGMFNVYRQPMEEDFSWGSFGTALLTGAASGALFGAIYLYGINGVSDVYGPLRRGVGRKLVNTAVYTVADVGAHTYDAGLNNALGNNVSVGDAALYGLVSGVVFGSIFSNFSAKTLWRRYA